MGTLVQQLRATHHFFPLLSPEQLNSLLEGSKTRTARAGEDIVDSDQAMRNHLVLIDGELEAHRIWSAPDGTEKQYVKTIKSADSETGVAVLSATLELRVRALTDVRYLLIDADSVDEMLGWSQQFSGELKMDSQLKRRMGLVKQVDVFRRLPLENVKEAFKRMSAKDFQAGDTVVAEGEPGDCYYLIESGEAEVWRTDVFTDETACVARLGPGDAFGEEALLQNAFRNATVRIVIAGRLLALEKSDFDELVRPGLVQEIAADAALDLIKKGEAQWLDCRYDMEYEDSRIPGARLVPLDQLREQACTLNPQVTYVVYCRSGRRSLAAAFLLAERNIRALSLTGGIRDWSYEIDAEPLK